MRVGRSIATTAVIWAMMGLVPELTAQTRDRQGFWWGLGVGAGFQLNEPASGLSSTGAAWYLRAGGTLNQWLRIGGEGLIWFTPTADVSRGNGNAMAFAQVFPVRGAGFFFKGGFGLAGSLVESSSSGGASVTNSGFGTGVGAGYEFRASESLFINVGADLMIQVIDFGVGTSTSSFLLFTVGIGTG